MMTKIHFRNTGCVHIRDDKHKTLFDFESPKQIRKQLYIA